MVSILFAVASFCLLLLPLACSSVIHGAKWCSCPTWLDSVHAGASDDGASQSALLDTVWMQYGGDLQWLSPWPRIRRPRWEDPTGRDSRVMKWQRRHHSRQKHQEEQQYFTYFSRLKLETCLIWHFKNPVGTSLVNFGICLKRKEIHPGFPLEVSLTSANIFKCCLLYMFLLSGFY